MPLSSDSVSRNARRKCHSERTESFRRPSGRFAAAIANTPGFRTTSNCRSPPTEAAPSIRGADPVLAGAALRTNGPKRGAAVFHGHPIDVPGRSLGPPLQTVDFDSVRRCRNGQLLHCLALILLWPARLRRSQTLFRSIAAPRAQIARGSGPDVEGNTWTLSVHHRGNPERLLLPRRHLIPSRPDRATFPLNLHTVLAQHPSALDQESLKSCNMAR